MLAPQIYNYITPHSYQPRLGIWYSFQVAEAQIEEIKKGAEAFENAGI